MRGVLHCKPNLTTGKKIAIFGFGSQAKSWALNLKESGFNVFVCLRNASQSILEAENLGIKVETLEQGAKIADIILLLTPDETHKNIFIEFIKPNFKKGGVVVVAHGLSFYYNLIEDFKEYNICMLSPKAVGSAVRSNFKNGNGILSLVSIFHELDSNLMNILEELALGIGSIKIKECTFKEECETDLFGEQAVLCGGVIQLLKIAFEVMNEAGYEKEMAYYECVQELKLITDVIYEKGIEGLFTAISSTAKYGGLKIGKFLIDESVKERMRQVLQEIQNGNFAKDFLTNAGTLSYELSEIDKTAKEVLKNMKL